MNTYEIGLYEKALPKQLSWRERLCCARECGYDFLELSIDETQERRSRLEWDQAERTRLLDLSREVGLPFGSICLSAHRKYPMGAADAGTRKESMRIMSEAIQLASDLGIRMIQLAGYDVYYEQGSAETEAAFRRNLRTAVNMAAAKGILLGFETMETPFMDTTAKSMRYVSALESPYLGVYPDAGNLTNAALKYSTDVLSDLETGRGHLIALHLKETVPGKYREIPFLTGHVNFPAVIAKAWALGVRRYVTELWDVGKESWREDICFANRTMREILDAQNTDI